MKCKQAAGIIPDQSLIILILKKICRPVLNIILLKLILLSGFFGEILF